MDTTTIALIRHGETDWNAQMRIQGRTDIPLNEAGVLQAQLVSELLREQEWHRVCASPLSRAARTAEIIAAELKLANLELREDLVERFFGAAEGLSAGPKLDAVRLADGEFLHAETEYEVGLRGIRALEDIHERYAGSNLILVSHGSYIRCTLNQLFEIRAPRIDNAGLTLLRRHQNGWFAEVVNNDPVTLGIAP
jgi:probable phosphoglycerate mutase